MVTLETRRWVGLTSAPAGPDRWPASPAHVLSVEPLNAGADNISFSLAVPLQPSGPALVEGKFKVISRSDAVIVLNAVAGSAAESLGEILVLEPLTRAWVGQHWTALLERSFPPAGYIEQKTVEDLVSQVFRDRQGAVLTGATEASFGSKNRRMPRKRLTVTFQRTFEGLDSCLIRNGHIPEEMEDKWFIHRKGGQLLFRRSWTGVLVYAADIREEPGKVSFDRVTINRDPKQYSETDTERDLSTLAWLIDRLLLGRASDFPFGDRGILQAWSTGGKAVR